MVGQGSRTGMEMKISLETRASEHPFLLYFTVESPLLESQEET
jgi:hypothetical protein